MEAPRFKDPNAPAWTTQSLGYENHGVLPTPGEAASRRLEQRVRDLEAQLAELRSLFESETKAIRTHVEGVRKLAGQAGELARTTAIQAGAAIRAMSHDQHRHPEMDRQQSVVSRRDRRRTRGGQPAGPSASSG